MQKRAGSCSSPHKLLRESVRAYWSPSSQQGYGGKGACPIRPGSQVLLSCLRRLPGEMSLEQPGPTSELAGLMSDNDRAALSLNSLGLCPLGVTWEAVPGVAVLERGCPRRKPGVQGPEPQPCASVPVRVPELEDTSALFSPWYSVEAGTEVGRAHVTCSRGQACNHSPELLLTIHIFTRQTVSSPGGRPRTVGESSSRES